MHIFLCGENSRVLVVTITYAGGPLAIELPVSDKATKEYLSRARVSAGITHHDNQKIDGNELFMIEDVPTSEYDDVTENPET